MGRSGHEGQALSTWLEFAHSAPELAARVGDRFISHRHHTMATVRRDGAPRISGTEVQIADGQFCFGIMPGARRALDLWRDPRVAIHSHSLDPPADDPGSWPGEAKVSGWAATADSGPQSGGQYRVDIRDVVLTYLDGGRLVVEHWSQDGGTVRHQR